MVSKEEVGPYLGPQGAATEDKAVTLRSVLLRRDRPDVERHLPRRQRHWQQVRFKELEDSSASEESPIPNTPRASATPKWWWGNSARRSWPQAEPCALPPPHPSPRKGRASSAIGTSPGFQRPPWAAPLTSESACDFAGQDLPLWGAPASLSADRQPPASSLAQLCPKTRTTLSTVRPPPPHCPCPLYPGQGPCLSASPPSQHKPRAHSPRPPCNPGGPHLGPPALPPGHPAPQQASPGAPKRGSPPPYPLAQDPLQKTPLLASPLLCSTSPRREDPHLPHTGSSPSAMAGKPSAAPVASPVCLGATQVGQPSSGPPAENHLPSLLGPRGLLPPRAPSRGHLPGGCLSPMQAEALRQVQDLLQLLPVGRGPAEEGEEHPPPSQDLPRAVDDVRSRLQSLEGVLETSQQTIRMLLGVIQDLERKEARRDGRQTGQDITNCGMCRDCACVIYSVEQDFRQQEGRLRQALSPTEVELGQSAPPVAATPGPPCQPLPAARLPTKAEARKVWRKCF